MRKKGYNVYKDTIIEFAELSTRKLAYLKNNPVGFLVSTMMAGAYVGVGIILSLTLGNEADPTSAKLIMGCFFGITLTLIVFAGAELFSGHTMFMTFGWLYKKVRTFEIIIPANNIYVFKPVFKIFRKKS